MESVYNCSVIHTYIYYWISYLEKIYIAQRNLNCRHHGINKKGHSNHKYIKSVFRSYFLYPQTYRPVLPADPHAPPLFLVFISQYYLGKQRFLLELQRMKQIIQTRGILLSKTFHSKGAKKNWQISKTDLQLQELNHLQTWHITFGNAQETKIHMQQLE